MISIEINPVAAMLQFLQPSFPHCERPSRVYNHIGALLADVSLQAGLNYDHVVRPRVNAILANFPDTERVSELKARTLKIGVQAFLQWKGLTKIGVFMSMLRVLDLRGIESVDEVCDWSCTEDARTSLLEIRGFGEKSFDYLRLLCGFESIPLDRHLIRFLELTGVNCRSIAYNTMQDILFDACAQIGLEPYKAERGLWVLMRSCAR